MTHTIDELLDCFCDEAQHLRNQRPTTITWYRQVMSQFLRFHRGRIKYLHQVDGSLIRDWFCHKRTQGEWTADTLLGRHKALGLFFKWCVDSGYMTSNPVDGIPKPRLEKKLPKSITMEDAELVLDTAFHVRTDYRFTRYRNRAMIAVLIFAGLRRQEMLNLQLEDLDWENRNLLVRCGKGGKDRVLPMLGRLAGYLRQYLGERERLGKEGSCLFTTLRSSGPMTEGGFRKVIKAIREACGVDFSAHRLRHTFATLMAGGDANLRKLQEMMGHSSITTTEIYLTASARALRPEILKHPMARPWPKIPTPPMARPWPQRTSGV